MKFLEYTPLDSVNYFLSHINLGECTLKGNLEAYSCKHAGSDKKMSFSLEHEILDHLGQSSDSDSQSPTGFLSCRSSRKTLIYLVLTLGHIYPDYDFSAVHAHRFFREEEWDGFVQIFNTYMFEATKEWATANEGCSLLESTTKAIDEAVKLAECEIYSYNPDAEGDPLLEKGAINLATEGLFLEEMSNDDEDEGGMFDDMDM